MRKTLLHNWGLKLASLLLAIVLWFLVVRFNDPPDTRTFSGIPVTLTNTELLEKENKVYEVLDNTDRVRVTVRGPKSVTDQMRASDIVAEADVSKLTDINTIVITYPGLSAEIESVSGDHEMVRLNVEEKSSKWVKVQYSVIGEVAEGYLVAGATPDQTLIEVTGPKSAVEQISYAGVEINVTGATGNLSANVEVLLYNAENEALELPAVTKNVNYIHMSVEVLATKEIPIELNTTGTPAAGFLATGVVTCEPSSIRIAGTLSALANVSKLTIPGEKMNLEGEESDLVNTINIREYLPDNVRLADSSFNGRVTVTAYIEPEAERTIEVPLENISVTNVPSDLEVVLPYADGGCEFKIAGLRNVIETVSPGDIKGTSDIAAWMEDENMKELTPGSYFIPVSFVMPENVVLRKEVMLKVTVLKVEE